MRLIVAALLALACFPALAQKRLIADVPWSGADNCVLAVQVSQNPVQPPASQAPAVTSTFPVTVDAARGKPANGNRVCVADPASWPAGFYWVSLKLTRNWDGATSTAATGAFSGAPAYLSPPTGLQVQ